MDRMIGRAEVAKILGVSPMTLIRIFKRGDGPPFYMVGQRQRFKESEVIAWLESKRFEAGA